MQYGPIKQSKDLKVGEVVRMLYGVFGDIHNEIVRTGKVPITGIQYDFRKGYDTMTVMRVADPGSECCLERDMHRLERPYLQHDVCSLSLCSERLDLPVTSEILWEVLR